MECIDIKVNMIPSFIFYVMVNFDKIIGTIFDNSIILSASCDYIADFEDISIYTKMITLHLDSNKYVEFTIETRQYDLDLLKIVYVDDYHLDLYCKDQMNSYNIQNVSFNYKYY